MLFFFRVLTLTFLGCGIAHADAGFRWVVEPKFEDASSAHGGIVPIKEGGLWGFIDAEGKWLFEPAYEQIQKGADGRFPVLKDGKWGVINTLGNQVVRHRFDQIGLPGVLTPVRSGKKWLALTKTGAGRFNFELDEFIGNDGFCVAGKKGGRNVMLWMGKDPKMITLDGVDKVFRPRDGHVLIKMGDKRDHTQCRNWSRKNRRFVDEARSVSEQMAAIKVGGKWGFRPLYGGKQINPRFAKVRDFSEGLAPVQDEHGKWGYIDYQGTLVIRHRFDAAYGHSDGLAGVRMGDKRGFINARGDMVVAPMFEDFWRHEDGLIPVKLNGLWGIIAPKDTDLATAFDLPLKDLAKRPSEGRADTVVPSVPHFYFGQDIQSRHDVSFSADGKTMTTIVTAVPERNPEFREDGEVALWDRTTLKLIKKVKVPELTQAIVLKDHNLIMAGTHAGDILLLSPESGKILFRKRMHQGGVTKLSLSPDGTRIVSLGGNKLRVWGATFGELQTSIFSSETKLAFTTDGNGVWLANQNGGIRHIGLDGRLKKVRASKNLMETRYNPWNLLQPGIAISATGTLARIEWNSIKQSDGYAQQGTVVLTGAKEDRAFKLPIGFSDILSIAFSPDGTHLLLGGSQSDASRASTSELRLYKVADLSLAAHWKSDRNGPGFLSWFDRLAFDDAGRVIVIPGEGGEIRVMDPALDSFVQDYGAPLALNVQGVNFLEEQTLYMLDTRGTIRAWDMENGALASVIRTPVRMGFENMISLDGGQLYVRDGFGEAAVLVNPKNEAVKNLSDKERDRLDGRAVYSSTNINATGALGRKLTALAKTLRTDRLQGFAQGDLAWVYSSDGRNEVYSVKTKELLATFMANEQGDWVVLTPEGFFNASRNGGELLSVVSGFTAFSIEQAYQTLFRPDLVREKLAGDPNGTVRKAAERVNLKSLISSGAAPAVSFSGDRGIAALAVEQPVFKAEVSDQGGGIGRIEWRVNGRIAHVAEPDTTAQILPVEARLFLDEGRNEIEITAFNAANLIASKPARKVVEWMAGTTSANSDPALFVLAVGVNDYLDSRLRLRYAVDDAKALSRAIGEAGSELFSSVNVTTLLDQEVTDQNLNVTFHAISEKMGPGDVFVFFLAGHGKTLDGKYHFIPQDFRMTGADPIRDGGINQTRWQEWLARIPARKAVLIYDTCESGSLTNQRGLGLAMEQNAAVQRLVRATGRTILTASTDDAPALEGYQGHGVFTYALLEALAKGDQNKNETIELTELAGYLDQRVPEISMSAFGHSQIPQMSLTGSDFAIGRRYAALDVSKEIFPVAPSHVLAPGSQIFDAPGGKAIRTSDASGFAAVFLIDAQNEYARIARNGEALGWVLVEALSQLN